MDQQPPNVHAIPSPPPPRHQVLVGRRNGETLMVVVDNETAEQMMYDIPTALAVAGNMAMAAAKVLEDLRAEAQDAPTPTPLIVRPTLVGPAGEQLT